MTLLCGFVRALTVLYIFGLVAAKRSDFGPDLQEQFRVGKLPNVTWTIARQCAVNLPVQRRTNLTLFFWGFESKRGLLTTPAGKTMCHGTSGSVADVFLVHSGPGSSSMVGLLHENGPIRLNADYTASENRYSWDKLADAFWIGQHNTMFGGIQGFTRRPSTPWCDDNGEFASIVHQERGWIYVLFHAAGHLVPALRPVATFLREFTLGNNETGLVTNVNTPALGEGSISNDPKSFARADEASGKSVSGAILYVLVSVVASPFVAFV
ncbi:hypothetical protein BDM02DRAFT_3187295 [Thelephora ganbajun]|uniref:Uncharacterized protein n=1 Tax=Thelephora ganbajun TaxID=370292 RepID=A0ACB6ZFM3_THEGA|nr:hypothetical protein BDM02DRAFT_3187295 [Thelephora ganbajun]